MPLPPGWAAACHAVSLCHHLAPGLLSIPAQPMWVIFSPVCPSETSGGLFPASPYHVFPIPRDRRCLRFSAR